MGQPEIRRVGVIGLGRMGLPMAGHLARAGFEVLGFDRHSEARAALALAGGQSLASVEAVARSSHAVLLMVTDDVQVKQVAVGAGGVLAAAPTGAVMIISSTVKPSTCREVATAAPRDVSVLDAPVARGQRAAEDGTLTVYVGGPAEAFHRCRPVFEAFGREIFHIGADVGAGQVAKLANNLILRAGVVAVYEALTLAVRLGVSPRRLLPALAMGSADSYAVREFHLINQTWAEKDLAQAMEVAAEWGAALPLTDRVRELTRALTREELRRILREE